MDVVALVLGAGRGVRLGAELPKARVRIAGRTLLHWSADALGSARGVEGVLPVLPPEGEADLDELRAGWCGPARLLEATAGGDTRQDSLARGLASLAAQAPEAAWVLVHDAARCLVLPEDADAVLAAARTSGAALPVAPVEDTIKEVSGERVVRTLERGVLARALTPQAFRVTILREALEKARQDGFQGTDCASLVERLGIEVSACAGRAENFKVTGADDLARAEAILRARGVQA